MNLKCGIVGLPNVGKSSLFNSLVRSSQAEMGNYPFCTIEANRGQSLVPDTRLQKISAIFKPQKTIPTFIEFIDIAGLIKGASQGEGLGNKFLSHIRWADSLLHLIRAFEDRQVSHVCGGMDPVRDAEIVNTELLLSDLEVAERRWQKIHKTAQTTGDKLLRQELDVLKKALDILSQGRGLKERSWSAEELACLKPLNFISLKPVLYICNCGEGDLSAEQPAVASLRKSLGENAPLLTVSCSLEAEMAGWTDEEKTDF